jgi:CoA:oxalate CoA-transferase
MDKAMSAASAKPLDGIRILDFSRILAGPFCTALLADLGADVIKVESPSGDDQRSMGAFRDGVSVSFELINRNKRSLRLDLKHADGRAIACALAQHCDVVVENFRPGVAKKLGIDYDALRAVKPDLVYCSISGFGQDGPLAAHPSYDVIAQSMSGLMSITGWPEGEPLLVGESIGDSVTGLFAAWGIVSALYRRAMSGQGARLDIAMFDSLFTLLPTALAQLQATRASPGRHGNRHPLSAPFGAYRAKDKQFILAIANNSLFTRFANMIGRPELADDSRFSSDRARRINEPELCLIIEQWSGALLAKQAVEQLLNEGIPSSEIQDVASAADSVQVDHRVLLTSIEHPVLGTVRLPEQPVQMTGLARGQVRRAPELGEHSADILHEFLDKDQEAIAALRAARVI